MMQVAIHYKGGMYEIIGHGREEATRAPVVIYKHRDNQTMDDLYTRPLVEFYGHVTLANGETVPRFRILNPEG